MKPYEVFKALDEGKKMIHPSKGDYFYKDGNTLWMVSGDMAGDVTHMSLADLNFFDSWVEKPKFVDFNAAMRALEAGNLVQFYDDDWESGYFHMHEYIDKYIGFYSFDKLLTGKWTIKEK